MLSATLHTISQFSATVPFLVGLFLYSKLDRNSKVLLILLFLASVSQLLSYFIVNRSAVWLFFNFYAVVDAIFWAYIFYVNTHNRSIRNAIALIFVIQLAAFLLFAYNNGVTSRFFSEFVCLNSLSQSLFVLLYFLQRYRSEEMSALERQPLVWFSLGLLIYAPTTYFLFAFYDIVRAGNQNQYSYLWSIHDLMNAFMYGVYTIGIYVNVKRNFQ